MFITSQSITLGLQNIRKRKYNVIVIRKYNVIYLHKNGQVVHMRTFNILTFVVATVLFLSFIHYIWGIIERSRVVEEGMLLGPLYRPRTWRRHHRLGPFWYM